MWACFIFLLCTLMMSAKKSLEKKIFTTFKPLGWKCYKTIGSYVSCAFIEIWSTWEVWRALKKLELLSATPQATLMHLSCSPNFPHASYLDERTLTNEPIVNFIKKEFFHKYPTPQIRWWFPPYVILWDDLIILSSLIVPFSVVSPNENSILKSYSCYPVI